MARLTPEGLIASARSLVPAGRGRPPEADLRRSISTAYYSAFCALGDQVASPYSAPLDMTVRRLVSHGAAYDVLNQLTRRDPGSPHDLLKWHPDLPPCDTDLAEFGSLFCVLRDAREQADYDHLWTATKRDADDAIGHADLAIDHLRTAARRSPQQVQAVCLAIIAGNATRKRLRH